MAQMRMMGRLKQGWMCGVCVIALSWGANGTPVMAQSFTIPSGTTETTPQTLNNGDTGVIESGGTLATTDPATPAIIGTSNNNEVTNNGTLSTDAAGSPGIQLTDGNTVTNTGSVVTQQAGSIGILVGSNNRVTNSGTITLIDPSSTVAIGGIDNNTIIHSGTITTGGLGPHAIFFGDGNTIDVSGTINSAGGALLAGSNNMVDISGTLTGGGAGPPIVFFDDNNQINFSGSLTSGDRGGIFFRDGNTVDVSGSIMGGGFGSAALGGDDNNVVSFSGSIVTMQDGGFGIDLFDNNMLDVSGTIETLSDFSDAILLEDGNTVDVSGSLSTAGIDSNGIFGDNDNTLTISGSINVTGDDSDGIEVNDFNRITNSGTIITQGIGSADAIEVDDQNIIINTGTLIANGDALANGIDGESNNQVYNSGTISSGLGAGIDFTAGTFGNFVFNNGLVSGNGTAIDFGPGDDRLQVANGSVLDGLVNFSTGSSAVYFQTGNHTITSTGTTPTIGANDDIFFVQNGDTVTSLDEDLLGISELNYAFLDQTHQIHRVVSKQGGLNAFTDLAAFSKEVQVASNDGRVYGTPPTTQPIWAAFYGGFAERDENGQQPDSDHRFWGGMAGARVMHVGDGSLGLFGGYGSSRIDSNGDRTTAETDRFYGGAYGAVPLGKWAVTANAFGGVTQTDSVRNISNNTSPGGLDAARADVDSLFVSAGIETARLYHNALGSFGLKPSGGVRYAGEWTDGYTETGAVASLTVSDRTAHAMSGFAELALVTTQNQVQVDFGLGAEGRAQMGDDSVNVVLLATPFTASPADDDTSIDAYARLGVHGSVTDRLSLFLDLEGRTGSDVDIGASAQTGLSFLF